MRSTWMRALLVVLCATSIAAAALAQSDRGTITGTISDATGAVLPGVSITATNTQTAAKYETVATETGNYTLAQLPSGTYEMSVELPGFKKYVRQGITVQVAQTLRIDANLEIGANSEEITITADASLLRTESSDLSHVINAPEKLPIFGIGTSAAGSSGIRNPLAITQLIPGTYFQPNTNIRVNGAPVNSQAIRVEGQDATNSLIPFAQAQTQPSVDAIQEVSIQTSNYAAEYGQTGGGVFNYTMKSGTNQYHGSVYDYAANEALNAGQAYTPGNPRPRARRNDYGFTVGGPVRLPKYNGHDRTFFFFNFEQYREKQQINNQTFTVPTARYRNGEFGEALTGRVLGTDPLLRPIIEGTIYDPLTTRVVNGQVVRDPFPGNIIPRDRWDPVAVKIQNLIPASDSTGVVNNYHPSYPSQRITSIPAIKVDHSLSAYRKIAFYWSRTATASQYSPQFGGSDGLPSPVTAARGTFIESHVERLTYDDTITPRLLLHIGVGYQHNDFKDNAPTLNYDAEKELGLKGGTLKRQFPQFQGLGGQAGQGQPVAARGGMKDMGPGPQSRSLLIKPTANTSLTWVKNNHTYKFGGEFRLDGFPIGSYVMTAGQFVFSPAQTGLPYVNSTTISGGAIGFPYASFLLGLVDNGNIASPANTRLGKTAWGFFAQDTWKVTRTFTLDYGLRWDYFTYLKEQYGRLPSFSPTAPNPTVGGLPGASMFEGAGPGRCNCTFANNYPYAFGPRIGIAYQITPKTVARVGWGVAYGGTSNTRPGGTGSTNPFSARAFGDASMRLQDGIPLTGAQVAWPKYDPGLFPISQNGVPSPPSNYPSVLVDPHAGRPSRIMQWSIGLQREISTNFVVDASYVGSRGVWWTADYLKDINALTPERLAAFGLNLNSLDDRMLLTSRLDSQTAATRGFNRPPYAGFPASLTVAQSLRPFPQFLRVDSAYAPLGNNWYDALQVKATKRYSYGLDFTTAFSWQKELTVAAENENGGGVGGAVVGGTAVNDVFNWSQNKALSQFSRPLSLNIAVNYQLPRLNTNKVLSWSIRDWQFGIHMQYASGLPIRVPLAQSNLNQ